MGPGCAGRPAIGGGTIAGPIPGPMADSSTLRLVRKE
jgi:hypothetical protein